MKLPSIGHPTVLMIQHIARVCHEANRAYCLSMNDETQLPWSQAPQWQRDSAVEGVRLHLFNDVGPEASHVAWMEAKKLDGWVYGERKDATAKTHPCMVPFEQLAPYQQFKDVLFASIVHAYKGCLDDGSRPMVPVEQVQAGEVLGAPI